MVWGEEPPQFWDFLGKWVFSSLSKSLLGKKHRPTLRPTQRIKAFCREKALNEYTTWRIIQWSWSHRQIHLSFCHASDAMTYFTIDAGTRKQLNSSPRGPSTFGDWFHTDSRWKKRTTRSSLRLIRTRGRWKSWSDADLHLVDRFTELCRNKPIQYLVIARRAPQLCFEKQQHCIFMFLGRKQIGFRVNQEISWLICAHLSVCRHSRGRQVKVFVNYLLNAKLKKLLSDSVVIRLKSLVDAFR